MAWRSVNCHCFGVLYRILKFSVAFAGEQSGPSEVQSEVQTTTAAQPVTAPAPADATATTTSRKPQATPAVRRIASEHNVRKLVHCNAVQ